MSTDDIFLLFSVQPFGFTMVQDFLFVSLSGPRKVFLLKNEYETREYRVKAQLVAATLVNSLTFHGPWRWSGMTPEHCWLWSKSLSSGQERTNQNKKQRNNYCKYRKQIFRPERVRRVQRWHSRWVFSWHAVNPGADPGTPESMSPTRSNSWGPREQYVSNEQCQVWPYPLPLQQKPKESNQLTGHFELSP